ncbi:MAG: winged helix-turn-helix transcriptional regulator [Promethearchaeota archaeon]
MKEKSIKSEKLAWHSLKHDNHKECVKECKVQQVLMLLGKKYLMPIIRLLLLNETLRFNEILAHFNGSPKTITARLRELEKHGIINRTQFNEIPPKVEYSLTDQGKELEVIFERLANWALDLTLFNKLK